MIKVVFEGASHELRPDESLLDGLLAQGVPVPFGCKSGQCQACLLQCLEGHPPAHAQKGLRPSLVALDHFLACQCQPWEGLRASLPNSDNTQIRATVRELKPLNPEIMLVSLEPETPVSYRAGQFIRLFNPEGVGRSYSLASVNGLETRLVLHVRRYPGGILSSWIHEKLRVGEKVRISQPAGECFYLTGQAEQPLLLAGTGSGLAPLYGILRDALNQGHTGEIHLYHGARTVAGLYLVEELRTLESDNTRFHYHACISSPESHPPEYARLGRASDIALAENPNLKDWRVYLCGNPDMVRTTQMQAFLAGAALDAIHADPFDAQSTPQAPE